MQGSDSSIFDSLVREYRQPLTKAAYHLCGNQDAAHDIVQETFVDAFRGFAKLREPEKTAAWLYSILRRKAITYRRRRKVHAELSEDVAADDRDDAHSLLRGIVLDQMAKLADDDREILAGKYLIGLSYKELAVALGIKEGAVRARCFRAKERLRAILKGQGVGVPGKR